jgi:hypothetical protein
MEMKGGDNIGRWLSADGGLKPANNDGAAVDLSRFLAEAQAPALDPIEIEFPPLEFPVSDFPAIDEGLAPLGPPLDIDALNHRRDAAAGGAKAQPPSSGRLLVAIEEILRLTPPAAAVKEEYGRAAEKIVPVVPAEKTEPGEIKTFVRGSGWKLGLTVAAVAAVGLAAAFISRARRAAANDTAPAPRRSFLPKRREI